MSLPDPSFERVWPLIEAACLGTIFDRQMQKLQNLLLGDAELQRAYLEYCRMHAELRYLCRAQATNEAILARIASEEQADSIGRIEDEGTPCRAGLPSSPALGFLGGAYQGTVAYFSEHHMVFSYLVAVVCFAVAALVGSLVQVSQNYNLIATRSAKAPDHSPALEEMVFVGRITGMVDVKWSDDPHYLPPLGFAHVSLGRKYILSSGLLEITYDSGAKVILQGPCTYEVESTAGGYLSLGKLTARVKSAKPQAANQKSAISNQKSPSSFILYPSSLFSVRTPIAIVTDLGTEFGVEVGDEGTTTSHVFRGSVKVQVVGESLSSPIGRGTGSERRVVRLGAGESVRVERGVGGDPRLVLGDKVGGAPKFVQQLYEPPRVLDLLDIVAGGNGTGRRREHGIDPSNGLQDTVFLPGHRSTDGKYHRAKYFDLVDGVFMPVGGSGPVQLDSAGHAFPDFPRSIQPGTYGTIWARAAEVPAYKRKKAYTRDDGQWQYWFYAARFSRFMPERRGLLVMFPATGITFDLEAIRKAHDNLPLVRFRAAAGKVGSSLAELWVFVDGRLAWKSTPISAPSGVKHVEVTIQPGDRFLTLVSTEASDGCMGDWMVFGDPVLEYSNSDQDNQ